ncbi:MAG: SDR family NAD(P)-dependent oxidoreductase, partial [Phycisphaerae bacterium]|nr:SDR family NAD(P)-dependent oxidoreductase [Phycisphaerae bacterium]
MTERKVAIVTGASGGIGKETALALVKRGYAVVLGARRGERLKELARLCRNRGGEALAQQTDVSDRQQVDALVAAAVDSFGRVDVMVNNAGF